MMFRIAGVVAMILALCAGAHTQAAEVAGVKLDDKIRVGDADLILNGAGVRTKFTFKGYVVGLYLLQASHEASTVLNGNSPKRMALWMLRDISRETLLDAIRDGTRENTAASQHVLLVAPMAKMETLFTTIPSVHKGDTLMLDFSTEGVTVSLNGEIRGKVAGEFFAQALLRVWLGEQPVDAALKKSLLAG